MKSLHIKDKVRWNVNHSADGWSLFGALFLQSCSSEGLKNYKLSGKKLSHIDVIRELHWKGCGRDPGDSRAQPKGGLFQFKHPLQIRVLEGWVGWKLCSFERSCSGCLWNTVWTGARPSPPQTWTRPPCSSIHRKHFNFLLDLLNYSGSSRDLRVSLGALRISVQTVFRLQVNPI